VTARLRGSDLVCAELAALGVRTVFALPGTQNVALFDALRRSSLRTVVPTSELTGAFMACGYARASGEPGVLFTIPGPGFTYALSGLAEARLDSIPLVHLTGTPATGPGDAFRLQAIDQAAMASPVTKGAVRVDAAVDVAPAVRRAFRIAS
jgi:acetolactate synthase-1/2/3 large subunit